MPDMSLEARSPLDGCDETVGDVSIAEVVGRSLVSAAVPHGGDRAFAEALAAGFGASRPATGEASAGKKRGAVVLGLQPDQVMILFDEGEADPIEIAGTAFGDKAHLTDQSDGWAMLQVSGTGVRRALERLCPLDLDPAIFPEGKVARTAMERLGVIVMRDGRTAFF